MNQVYKVDRQLISSSFNFMERDYENGYISNMLIDYAIDRLWKTISEWEKYRSGKVSSRPYFRRRYELRETL